MRPDGGGLTRREWLLPGTILGLAAGVRLYRLDLTWFFLDQARDVSIASAIASGRDLPLLGPRIGWTHAYLGPLYYYVLAIPFTFFHDPLAGAVLVAACNVLATFILYRFAREHFGLSVAAYASALYAVFPLAIFSSRLVWHAGLLPLLTILFMQALYSLVVKGRSRSAISVLALLAVMTQLHLAAAVLAVVASVAVLAFRPAVRGRHLAAGLGLFLVLYGPYLAYEVSHGFANVTDLARAVAERGPGARGNLLAVLAQAFSLYRSVLDGFTADLRWPPVLHTGFSLLYAIEGLLLGLGVLAGAGELVRAWQGTDPADARARCRFALLLLWFALPLLVLGSGAGVIWWYYLDVLYPSQFILIGLALAVLSKRVAGSSAVRRWLVGMASGLATVIVLSQAWFQVAFQREVSRQGETSLNVKAFPVNATASPIGTVTSPSLGHRQRILRVLAEDFGVGPGAFGRRVHGALGLPAENDYILRFLRSQSARPRDAGGSELHFLVGRRSQAAPGTLAPSARPVGPYVIVPYAPDIDYRSWSVSVAPRTSAESTGRPWMPLSLPAIDLDLQLGVGEVLLARGVLDVRSGVTAGKIVAAATATALVEIVAAEVRGRTLHRISTRAGEISIMLPRASGWLMAGGWATEATFELGEDLEPGRASILVAAAGPGLVLKLDVYEARP